MGNSDVFFFQAVCWILAYQFIVGLFGGIGWRVSFFLLCFCVRFRCLIVSGVHFCDGLGKPKTLMMKGNYLFGILPIYGKTLICEDIDSCGLVLSFQSDLGWFSRQIISWYLDVKTCGFENEVTWSFLMDFPGESSSTYETSGLCPWESAPNWPPVKEVEDHRRRRPKQMGNMVTPRVWLDTVPVTLNPLFDSHIKHRTDILYTSFRTTKRRLQSVRC